MVREDAKKKLVKALRKKEHKALKELATELGCQVGELTHAIRQLVDEGLAVNHGGRPPKYGKA